MSRWKQSSARSFDHISSVLSRIVAINGTQSRLESLDAINFRARIMINVYAKGRRRGVVEIIRLGQCSEQRSVDRG